MASTAFASPALAKDDTWYVELNAGGMIVEDIDNLSGSNEVGTLDTKIGYDVGGIVGYDFGPFRLEAEASFRRAEEKGYVDNNVSLDNSQVGGGAEALSFMINGLVDFGPDDGLQGFVGGGAGVGRVKVGVLTAFPSIDIVDSDTGFAWQALAGVRAPINDNVDIGLKYRFYNQFGNDLVAFDGRDARVGFRSHSLMATLAYNFGEPAAPPPPPPPPPPPVCETGPYIVFFNWDKSDITPEAATILDNAVSAYADCGTAAIMLAGYTDRSGSATYNMGLAERRNASVRGYLTSRGVPDGRITSEAFGEANPRVPTADGVRELQNRRVEITYGPGSGM